MHLGEVIKDYRVKHGKMSLQAFADKCGLSKGYIAMLERNINSKTGEPVVPSVETFIKVAAAMAISLDELFAMVDENQPLSITQEAIQAVQENKVLVHPDVFPIEIHRYPLACEISCGEGIFTIPEGEEFITGNEINADFCVKARGDSMSGARIYSGDVVFIRETQIVDNGDIVAVLIDNEEIVLKRIYRYPDEEIIALHSENDYYKPLIFRGWECEQRLRILGKAVAFQSAVR